MIGHAREIESIENLGYAILYVGESRPQCPKCGKYALKMSSTDFYLCEKNRDGCGIISKFRDAGRRIKLWKVGKPVDGVDTLIYVGEEVLERLPKLTKAQMHDWYMQWDDAAIIDTLAKADLPDELSKVQNAVLMPPESIKKRERVGKISI